MMTLEAIKIYDYNFVAYTLWSLLLRQLGALRANMPNDSDAWTN